jgi:predicted AlkP superfamily phosphohydrolase/phosphomutase
MLAVFVLDAASVRLIDRLLAEGRLPALAELRRRGEWLKLSSPATHFSASAFQTLYHGTHLSEHGLYFPFQWSPADQRLRYIHTFPGADPVWERLARAGRRSLVVDPYECRVPKSMAGVFVSGWQFRNRTSLFRWSAPPEAHRLLARRFGRPPLVEEIFGQPSPSLLLRLRRHLVESSGRTADAVVDLLGRERFELLWAVFPNVHLGGHQLWDPLRLLRRASRDGGDRLDPAAARRLEDGLEEVYVATDAALGRIVSALPEGADVIVVSSAGMDVEATRLDLLPRMLEAVLSGRPSPGSQRRGAGAIWRFRAAIPVSLRAKLARPLPDRLFREITARAELRGVDWSRTRAFALPTDKHGYVRLNLRGRERHGVVDPAEAGALMDEIAAGLHSFRDADGSPSVARVDRVAEVMDSGPGVARLPDLLVHWNDRPTIELEGVSSPRFGDVRRSGGGTGRSGAHTPDAWALLAPGASRPRASGRQPHLVDIAATACSLLDADAAGLPGEPLLEARSSPAEGLTSDVSGPPTPGEGAPHPLVD